MMKRLIPLIFLEMSNKPMSSTASVLIHLRSVGEAAALKKAKFKISGENMVNEVDKFLRKQLKYEGSIYMYCGSGFSPSLDQKLGELYDSFQSGGELVINYGYQEAWG
jgi:ubiquitin-like protein ATG12